MTQVLPSPTHAVLGTSDATALRSYLELFGFEEVRRDRLPNGAASALYGLDEGGEESILAVPGAERGWLRVVQTPLPPRRVEKLDSRPFAIDFFSTDIEESVRRATAAGHAASPIATHRFGPLTIREVEIHGPDGVIVALLESPVRRATILDREPERLHSELHAVVWSVSEADAKLPFWTDEAGLEVITDTVFEGEDLAAVLGVAGRALKARLIVLSDADSNPARLELIEFLGEPAAEHPTWPLAAGLHAPAFSVGDLDAAMAALPGATFGEVVSLDTPIHPAARAVTAVAPGKLRFELWQESPSG